MKKFCVMCFALLAISSLLATVVAQDKVSVIFGKNMDPQDSRQVLVMSGTDTYEEVKPEADGFTYKVLKNSDVCFKVTPRENFVVYVWEVTEGEYPEEIRKSYSSTEQTLKVTRNIEVFADICELIPVKFIVPQEEGSTGKEVQVEEQGDFGRLIAPLEDGETYMLPKNRGAYFDPMIKDGYNILSWNFGNNGDRFPSRPDQFYKQNLPEGFVLYVYFYQDGETRSVKYTQPETAILVAKNQSVMDSPEIDTDSQVEPGDQILFEVYPFDNPYGKVELHHWVINGVEYLLDEGVYFTENSLSLFADVDLDVSVVPLAEYEPGSGIESAEINGNFSCSYNLSAKILTVKSEKQEIVELYSLAGEKNGAYILQNGVAEIAVGGLEAGIYVLRQGNESVKVYIQ